MAEQIDPRLGCTVFALLLLTACGGSQQDADAGAEVIKIGNTMPYSGPASAYGTIGKAIAATFASVNENGGVNGRRIDFISLDDAYSPPKTKEQVRKLVEREKVLFMMGNLGTAANSAVHKYLNRKGVPHLFVSTGATKWGQPEKYPWTMGWQPSYKTESSLAGRYLLENHPDGRLAILYQNDDYGKDYLEGLREALGDRADTMILATQSYEVSDPTVDAQILKLKASGADVFVNVATPKFAAQAIRKLDEIQWKPVHLLNAVANSSVAVLEPAGLERCKGLITLGYIVDPKTPGLAESPDFQGYLECMRTYYREGDPMDGLNLFGYNVALTMIHVLEKAGDDLSRENIMKSAASMSGFSLALLNPGITIDTAADDFFPIEKMQVAVFNGDYWEPVGEVMSAD
ncbi:MAG: ABC transporter substrate-binding protein [Acidobacteriota bacterium]|nr:ABC transporter substrate-binding protein [Acidobacteriota bacterium]